MKRFSPFGFLLPVSLSSPIFGFVGDFIDSEKTTAIKVKRAKWVDIHKFGERNEKDLGMTPGKLGSAWLYAKGGEVYEDGFFRSIEKLSDLQPSLKGQVAGLFQGGVGYQVKKATGVVLNSSGIQNVRYEGDRVIDQESNNVAHRWAELRKIQGKKKLKRTLEMRRISFARHRDTRAVLEGCELRIKGESSGKGISSWTGTAGNSGNKWTNQGVFMDIYISFIGFKANSVDNLREDINRGKLDEVILSREAVCESLGRVGNAITIKKENIGSNWYINKVDLNGISDKILALVGVHVNAFGVGDKISEWKSCKENSRFIREDDKCRSILEQIKSVLSINRELEPDGSFKISSGKENKCTISAGHWYNDRNHHCIIDGFQVHSGSKMTYSIEQELE